MIQTGLHGELPQDGVPVGLLAVAQEGVYHHVAGEVDALLRNAPGVTRAGDSFVQVIARPRPAITGGNPVDVAHARRHPQVKVHRERDEQHDVAGHRRVEHVEPQPAVVEHEHGRHQAAALAGDDIVRLGQEQQALELAGLEVSVVGAGPVGLALAEDPGVEVLRRLVWNFRSGVLVETLGLTCRLLLLHGGDPFVRGLFDDFFASAPPELFASVEAEAFGGFDELGVHPQRLDGPGHPHLAAPQRVGRGVLGAAEAHLAAAAALLVLAWVVVRRRMGPIARRTGTIFIRRSFGGDTVYQAVVEEYFGYLMARRFNLEWYFEGGRTRTGKLRPPRYGLLNYLAAAVRQDRAARHHEHQEQEKLLHPGKATPRLPAEA